MKTLLYATGETKKLLPLTEQIIPPMLPVLNRPVMDYSLELLARQNIKQIDISLYERAGEVEAYFGDGKYRGLKFNYHLQRDAWGNAGALRWAFPEPAETVLLLPADILIDIDLHAFIAFHEAHGACLSILTAPGSASPRDLPQLQVEAGRIVGLGGGPAANSRINTGVFLISPELIASVPPRKKMDVVSDLLPGLLEQGQPVYAYEFDGYWNPLQTFQQFHQAQFELCSSRNSFDQEEAPADLKFLSWEGKQIAEGIWTFRNNSIHPSVKIAPRFYINENCKIEKEVQIGPDVVMGRGVVVDQSATIQDLLILDNTYVGRLLNIQSKIVLKNLVIDIKSGEHITITDKFLLAETRDENVDFGLRRFLSSALALILAIILSPVCLLITLFLALSRTPIIIRREVSHTDIRWFVPIEVRGMRSFDLLQFGTCRKSGAATWIGKLLEVTQAYRIPELINVIKGDLAFVGVKPLSGEVAQQLSEDWQRTRFLVPAGITGIWYLQAVEDSPLDQVLIADAYYAATRSLKKDFQILWQTPRAWWQQVIKKSNLIKQ